MTTKKTVSQIATPFKEPDNYLYVTSGTGSVLCTRNDNGIATIPYQVFSVRKKPTNYGIDVLQADRVITGGKWEEVFIEGIAVTEENFIELANQVKSASSEGGGGSNTTIIDNLTSTRTDAALSANQGRVLNESITALSSNAVVYNSDDNIILRNGTKVAEAPKAGGVTHEILGINTYTDSSGTFDQFEVGSQEALYNINVAYNSRTEGHATADVYNNGSSTKQVFAYVSDIATALVVNWVNDTNSRSVTVPQNAIILHVNYNHTTLFSDEYTISGTTLTINESIQGNVEIDDRIEVTFLNTII